jgi:hypothetical protein
VASASARAVPAILRASPPLLLAGDPGELLVQGINMLQNDARLLLRLQGRYVQPAAAACDACACAAPVHPGSGASAAGQAAAAADAARFEQRCCGCCVGKLQLAGLLPTGARPDPAARPPSCCQAAEPAPAAEQPSEEQAALQQAGRCCKGQQEHASGHRADCRCGGETCAKAGPKAPSRRVVAGAPALQGVRLRLPDARQQQEQQEALLPGLLHLDVQRRAFTAPQGKRAHPADGWPLPSPARCVAPRGSLSPWVPCWSAALPPSSHSRCRQSPSPCPFFRTPPPLSHSRSAKAHRLAPLFNNPPPPHPSPPSAGARVLVVSSPAVHGELMRVAQRGGGALPQRLVDEVGCCQLALVLRSRAPGRLGSRLLPHRGAAVATRCCGRCAAVGALLRTLVLLSERCRNQLLTAGMPPAG